MAEGGYEGQEFNRFQTAHHIRKQAYWTQLSGGHHVYGHNDAWAFPAHWETWLAAPGAEHLRALSRGAYLPGSLVGPGPRPISLVSGQGSGFALNTAARSASGRWIIAYLSEPCSISLSLDSLAGSSLAQAWWIDPTSGERFIAGRYPVTRPAVFETPPGWADAVLLAEPLT